jgi:hypothetical protein
MGCIYNGSAQSVQRGLAQSWPFGLRAKPGIQSPLHRRWLTGEGGAGEEAWTTGNSWVAVGWKEAHHSGVSTVVVLGRWGNDGAGPVAGLRCSGNWSTSSMVLGWSCCQGRRGRRTVGEGYWWEALADQGMTTAASARTGGRRWWRCRCGRTMNSNSTSWTSAARLR